MIRLLQATELAPVKRIYAVVELPGLHSFELLGIMLEKETGLGRYRIVVLEVKVPVSAASDFSSSASYGSVRICMCCPPSVYAKISFRISDGSIANKGD